QLLRWEPVIHGKPPAQTTSQDSADRAGHCRHTRHRAATYRRPSAIPTSREAAVAAGRVPRATRRLAAISSARYGCGSVRRVQTTMYPPAVPDVATPAPAESVIHIVLHIRGQVGK